MKAYVDFEINKIQELRVIHALIENGSLIFIPESQKYKFKPLIDKFDLVLSDENLSEVKLSSLITINHEIPKTKIRDLSCPLIFPIGIVRFLYENWSENRVYKFSFAGLITPTRHKVIQNWLTNSLKSNKKLNYNSSSFKIRMIKKIYQKLFKNKTPVFRYEDLYISNSIKGRVFPGKSWDDYYYAFLLKSKFVLCPSGDFIWSYRFFETILSGAIPIIEEYCDVYSGYRFKYLSDDATQFIYNLDDARFNYDLCVSRMTIKG
jgi:hypothetical protein